MISMKHKKNSYNINIEILHCTLYKDDGLMDIKYKLNGKMDEITFVQKDGRLQVYTDANYLGLFENLDREVLLKIVDKTMEYNMTNKIILKDKKI